MLGQEEKERMRGCLEDYLRQRGINLRRHFRCLNPSHEDVHPSMKYNARAGNVHCFSCGFTYDLFDLVGLDYGLSSFPEQYEKARQLFGLGAPELHWEKEQAGEPVPEKPADLSLRWRKIKEQAEPDGGFFASRGITPESVERYVLVCKGGRVYFPVFQEGVCTGWCARTLEEGKSPRYRNSSGAMGIWNGDILSQDGGGRNLYITEGAIDAICLEQTGRSAIALCGSQNGGKLLQACRERRETAGTWRFVACGDADRAGKEMNRALEAGLAREGFSCRVLELDPAWGDPARAYQERREELESRLRALEEEPGLGPDSAAAGLEEFLQARRNRGEEQGISTGFSSLDRVLEGGLYPGLYVLGAISSLGKTSFVLQLADQIAASGRDVLYVSLEQSRFELIAKSLGRIGAELAGKGREKPYSLRRLLSGREGESSGSERLLRAAAARYAALGKRLFLVEGTGDIGPGALRQMAYSHKHQRGAPPVIVVDYLQILAPLDPKASDKQNTDRAVVELKRLSRDLDVPVLAVSSFNRENYRAAVSMEAFKESGAVEYSADVLMGLQLEGAGGRSFDSNAEKAREPRRVELVLLKNRSGIPYCKLPFLYRARHSLFLEADPFQGKTGK